MEIVITIETSNRAFHVDREAEVITVLQILAERIRIGKIDISEEQGTYNLLDTDGVVCGTIQIHH